MNLIILGLPGSGKSTQAKILAKKLGLFYVSSGDVSREIISEDSNGGREAKEKYDKGELIPDEILFGRLEKKLLQPEATAGVVLDGYPRDGEQLQPLNAMMARLGIRIDQVVLIKISEDEGLKRLHGRAENSGRTDDTERVFKERFRIYHEETEPIIDYFLGEGILVEVDGSGSISEVEQRIWEAVTK